MRESQKGGHAKDGGVIRTLHGKHGPAGEEVAGDKGVDKIRDAMEVGSTT